MSCPLRINEDSIPQHLSPSAFVNAATDFQKLSERWIINESKRPRKWCNRVGRYRQRRDSLGSDLPSYARVESVGRRASHSAVQVTRTRSVEHTHGEMAFSLVLSLGHEINVASRRTCHFAQVFALLLCSTAAGAIANIGICTAWTDVVAFGNGQLLALSSPSENRKIAQKSRMPRWSAGAQRSGLTVVTSDSCHSPCLSPSLSYDRARWNVYSYHALSFLLLYLPSFHEL